MRISLVPSPPPALGREAPTDLAAFRSSSSSISPTAPRRRTATIQSPDRRGAHARTRAGRDSTPELALGCVEDRCRAGRKKQRPRATARLLQPCNRSQRRLLHNGSASSCLGSAACLGLAGPRRRSRAGPVKAQRRTAATRHAVARRAARLAGLAYRECTPSWPGRQARRSHVHVKSTTTTTSTSTT